MYGLVATGLLSIKAMQYAVLCVKIQDHSNTTRTQCNNVKIRVTLLYTGILGRTYYVLLNKAFRQTRFYSSRTYYGRHTR